MITIETPVGPFTMVGDGRQVTGAAFGQQPPPGVADGPVPANAVDAVRAYFAGDLSALDSIPAAQPGTDYFQQAWQVLRGLDEPVSYTEFARRTGRPAAVRAAAQACARNQIALITPCHRVLRTDGSLGGYRWGIDVKRWLLKHEARIAAMG